MRSSRLQLDILEAREVPAAFPITGDTVAIRPDDGGIPVVHLVSATNGTEFGQVQAYEDVFRGGVHTAIGDITGDGVPDLVIAPGKGGGPRIRILDGQDGSVLRDFFVYEPQFTGGIYVALGDVNHDGHEDLITGTGVGGGPRVRILDGASLGSTVLGEFMAYEDSFRGGVLVASGDVNGDGFDDIVCGTGVGGGPRVLAFSGRDRSVLQNEMAYEDSFRGGVFVASGDVNGDGRDDLITGTGTGGGPVVRVFSGDDGRQLESFTADDSAFRGGVRVEALDVNRDGRDDVVAHLRHGNDDGFRVFSGGDGHFVSGSTRTVDDNPSAEDQLEGHGGVITPGQVSYIEGSLVSVDAAAKTATVRLQNGTTVVVRAGAGTKVKRDKQRVDLSAFVAGDKIEATIGSDGVAWEIAAKSPGFSSSGSGSGSNSEHDRSGHS
jgi:hypothetical protein